MPIRLKISGPRACFRRTEYPERLISYDVITPWSARAVIESIHWTPSIRWRVKEIRVLAPIRLHWMDLATGQLVPSDIHAATGFDADAGAFAHVLVDVSYSVTAEFELTARAGPADSAAGHHAQTKRKLARGQFFRSPCLGIESFPAEVSLIDTAEEEIPCHPELAGEIDLGRMLFDLTTDGAERTYYRPTMIDGIIDLSSASLVRST